jgi:hypothetical protein
MPVVVGVVIYLVIGLAVVIALRGHDLSHYPGWDNLTLWVFWPAGVLTHGH